MGRQGLRAEAWAARAWFPGRKDGHFPRGLISADFLADIQLQFPALVTCDFLVTFQGDFLIMIRFRKPSRSCLIVLDCECDSCDMNRYCTSTIRNGCFLPKICENETSLYFPIIKCIKLWYIKSCVKNLFLFKAESSLLAPPAPNPTPGPADRPWRHGLAMPGMGC